MHNHCDLFGQSLAVGDCVVYPNSNGLVVGTVIKLNPKMVKVRRVNVKWDWTSNKYPNDVVKVQGAEVTMYLLKNTKST